MEIRVPYFSKGKLILQYRGTNIVYKNEIDSSQILDCIFLGEKQMEPYHNYEKLFLEFVLIPQGQKIALTLQKKSVYRKVNINEEVQFLGGKNDCIKEFEVLMDMENIYFIGSFSIVIPNTLADARLEQYHFTAIFKRHKRIIEYIKECLPEIRMHIKSNELLM